MTSVKISLRENFDLIKYTDLQKLHLIIFPIFYPFNKFFPWLLFA